MNKWVRGLVFGLCVAINVWVMAVSLVDKTLPYSSDLVGYMTGAKMVVLGRADRLYKVGDQMNIQRQIMGKFVSVPFTFFPFRYPPFVILGYLGLLWIPFAAGYYINLGVGIIWGMVLVVLVSKSEPRLRTFWGWPFLALAFLPTTHALLLGQVTSFLGLVYAGIYYALVNKKDFMVGLLLGGFLIKPQLFLIAWPFLCFMSRDKAKFVKGSLVAIFVAGISSLIIAPKSVGDYWRFLQMTQRYDTAVPNLISLPIPIAILVVLGLGYFMYKKHPGVREGFLIFSALFLCMTPVMLVANAGIVLTGGLMLLGNNYFEKWGWGFVVVINLCYMLCPQIMGWGFLGWGMFMMMTRKFAQV